MGQHPTRVLHEVKTKRVGTRKDIMSRLVDLDVSAAFPTLDKAHADAEKAILLKKHRMLATIPVGTPLKSIP